MLFIVSYLYPRSKSIKEILVSSIAAGILVYLFLIIFQPFGTENFHHPYKYIILFPYTLIFGLAFFVSSLFVSQFKEWNIGYELLKVLVILLLGSIFSYFYNAFFISHVKLSLENYGYMFLYSLAIGIPISAIYILSRYIYLKNIPENTALDIAPQLINNSEETKEKVLKISGNNIELEVAEENFLYVQSMENYCSVYFLENNKVKKLLIRISLSNILKQVETHSIKKCHRSHIINLEKVKDLKGNAQGYKLILPEIDFEIPVSRSFISDIIPQLQQSKR
ncbi:LytTR family transcriptional regulator [Chryseobacterium sp. WG14]|uniref:LytTR family DNA-binding domain-containing protein n=1 Tax=unclassified Chryseobacterium TaxID=2593645 RepID=UPI00211E118B|nr:MULTISPECIES: LytTR family DNA-binding domain-containing protein [unclassified Chryseobacterium]MCQ9636493.1 LytTR family transcriptional regulator [Chryseobacterium sp. WG23]MCQ9640373.1 LytTR family transcriptional regulator [Chryseobacterium sp. WG14]